MTKMNGRGLPISYFLYYAVDIKKMTITILLMIRHLLHAISRTSTKKEWRTRYRLDVVEFAKNIFPPHTDTSQITKRKRQTK